MTKKKLSFKKVYICYLLVVIVAMIAAIAYVYMVLQRYENLRPEKCVQQAIEQLAAEAKKGDFWDRYSLPEMMAGGYESHLDVKNNYLKLYGDENVTFEPKSGSHQEDELFYNIVNNGIILGEVKLKAKGPAMTKLTILNMREWEIAEVKPVAEARDYVVSLPSDFEIAVNGIALTEQDGVKGKEKEITYQVSGMYLEPEFAIKNQEGKPVNYTVKNGQVMAEFYDYSLSLPTMLTLELNGESFEGKELGNSLVQYDIRCLEKPEIVLKDLYGNEVSYEGGNEVPLTFMTITADSRYEVSVAGMPVPETAVTTKPNKAYEQLWDYVENLPQSSVYEIAILTEEAEVLVKDEKGDIIELEKGKKNYDLTAGRNALETVPENVQAEIDVLDVAKKWSLFMSDDLPFMQVKKYLIEGSYQHKVALQYATGVDITFTSAHTLRDPAFTGEEVTNFVWITEDCFSVDISFVKHLLIRGGAKVDDEMNDRFYFVKYDDTEDGTDNPAWKLVSMKEIVKNEQ